MEKTAGTVPEKNMQAARMALGDSCRLLAACFYPPEAELFLQEGITDKLGALLKIACPAAVPLVPPARKYLHGQDRVELSVAYTRLFLGPPGVLAPPYASFYLDKNGGVMGPSSVEIMKVYGSAGLRLEDGFNELPDHIAVVLEFLYFLIFRETTAGGGDCGESTKPGNIRRRFLENFVYPWVPRFCGKITTADEHPFYTGLGKCLDTFIRNGFPEETTR